MKPIHLTSAAALALCLSGPALAADLDLNEIEVRADLKAVEGADAMEHWPEIESDLQGAIASLVNVTGDASDERLLVEIHAITLDDSYDLPDSGEFNQLQGTVALFEVDASPGSDNNDETDIAPTDTYLLRLDAVAQGGPLPEGWIRIPATSDNFYTALIDAFAAEVVKNLDDM